jgi:hypothetical protein
VPGLVVSGFAPQSAPYCHQCGQPYPWTTAKIEAAQEQARELFFLDPADRELLAGSIADLMRDTPSTELAATRIKRLLTRSTDEGAKLFLGTIRRIASAGALRLIFGP